MLPWEQKPNACLGLKECYNFNSLHLLSIYFNWVCFGRLTLGFILLNLALNLLSYTSDPHAICLVSDASLIPSLILWLDIIVVNIIEAH